MLYIKKLRFDELVLGPSRHELSNLATLDAGAAGRLVQVLDGETLAMNHGIFGFYRVSHDSNSDYVFEFDIGEWHGGLFSDEVPLFKHAMRHACLYLCCSDKSIWGAA
jgi:hypothetical protein